MRAYSSLIFFDCRCYVAVTVVEFVIVACVGQIQSVETRDTAHRDVNKLGWILKAVGSRQCGHLIRVERLAASI
jgi:hypothetical protein